MSVGRRQRLVNNNNEFKDNDDAVVYDWLWHLKVMMWVELVRIKKKGVKIFPSFYFRWGVGGCHNKM